MLERGAGGGQQKVSHRYISLLSGALPIGYDIRYEIYSGKKHSEQKLDLYVLFVDLTKTFGTVSRP